MKIYNKKQNKKTTTSVSTFAPSFIMFCMTDLGIDIAMVNFYFRTDFKTKLCW